MSVTLLDVLVDIPDPRRAEGKRHPLPQVLLFCILGNLCGAHSYKRMAAFIRKHFPVLKAHLKFIVGVSRSVGGSKGAAFQLSTGDGDAQP